MIYINYKSDKSEIKILVFILFRLFTGVYEPIMDYYLNGLLNDQYRATMLSVYSMAGSIGEILSGISIGAIAENRGISIAFYAGAVSLLFELILFFAINKIHKYEYSG
ncbi:MFS transporter [Thermoanaerobacterium thermosaccharolyticum]|uniref:MFS transporter n=1 Tax=Thermoanaerobacterium thermosaccharolyticum TaxID=1517 RepID=UPI0027AB5360|nr:MFS transporter [Thermoanaerobacterium thermosaccharolyticum]